MPRGRSVKRSVIFVSEILFEKTSFLSADGKTSVAAYFWRSETVKPRAILQLSHGMCEYITRYDAWARRFVEAGYVFCGNDHLGHGDSAPCAEELGFMAPRGGAELLVEDVHTALISIGQGMVMVTPLQAANIAAAFANGGIWYRPRLLDRVTDQLGRQLMKGKSEIGGRLPGSTVNIDTVRRAMFKVVNDLDGSGRRARRNGLEICGKTGSAESGPRDRRIVTTWFIAYVKYQNKTYAAALVYEEGRSGGSDCAPLMGAFFERFLLKGKNDE